MPGQHENEASVEGGRPGRGFSGLFPMISSALFGAADRSGTDDGGGHSAMIDGRTDVFNVRLALLGIVMVFVIGLRAFVEPSFRLGLTLFAWGVGGAFAAYLFGLTMGLLFGLPSTRGWTARRVETQKNSDGQPSASIAVVTAEGQGGAPAMGTPSPWSGEERRHEPEVPYDENTSLEQIADWLTKIIVGVGLTQFDDGLARFRDLSLGLTRQMFGPRAGNPMAGGLILFGFTALGFLMAYLWMRRYFISEMVIARRSALLEADDASMARIKELRRQAAQAEAARTASLAQSAESRLRAVEAENERLREEADQTRKNVESQLALYKSQGAIQESRASSIDSVRAFRRRLDEIRERASLVMQGPLQELLSGAESESIDPWRNRFGGQSAVNGFTLTGVVSELEGDPSRFVVDLQVVADAGDVRNAVAGVSGVQYFLHPTFEPMTMRAAFNTEGVAPLRIVAYGVFTVGVLVEEGNTLLELNLAGLQSAQDFPVFMSN